MCASHTHVRCTHAMRERNRRVVVGMFTRKNLRLHSRAEEEEELEKKDHQ